MSRQWRDKNFWADLENTVNRFVPVALDLTLEDQRLERHLVNNGYLTTGERCFMGPDTEYEAPHTTCADCEGPNDLVRPRYRNQYREFGYDND